MLTSQVKCICVWKKIRRIWTALSQHGPKLLRKPSFVEIWAVERIWGLKSCKMGVSDLYSRQIWLNANLPGCNASVFEKNISLIWTALSQLGPKLLRKPSFVEIWAVERIWGVEKLAKWEFQTCTAGRICWMLTSQGCNASVFEEISLWFELH